MRRSIVRRIIVVALAIGVVVLGIVAPLRSSQANAASPGGQSQVAVYTLVTGDRVAVSTTPDGRPNVTVLSGPSGSGAAAFEVMVSGPHLYVVPHDVAGFIGQPLSLDLFDVNALTPDTSSSSSSSSTAAQPQLAVDYTSGSAHQLPPGLSATASGSVAISDPKAFGRAIKQQWTAQKHGTDTGLFAGIARIAKAGAATPASRLPGALYTVTVKAFDRLGQKVEGDMGVVMNADDVNNFLAGQSYYRGEFAFSVPAGHYSISSLISTVYPDNSLDYTLAVNPEVTVTHDTVVILDARKGNRVAVNTPLPSSPVEEELNYQRNSQLSVSFTSSFVTFGNMPLYVTPTKPVTVGQMYFYPYYRLGDAQGSLNSYLYDLEFPYVNAIPSNLTQTVTQDQLATIDARYHSAVPGRDGLEGRVGIAPWQAASVGSINDLVAPLERTEYITARSDLSWLQIVIADSQSFGGFVQSNLQPYSPGEQTQATWLAQPMVAGIQQDLAAAQPCPVCRSGDTLSTMLFPFVDSDGHLMLGDGQTTQSLTLYQDGTQVGQAPFGFASFPMSAQPATYQLVYDVAENADWWPTSTQEHTAWTFSSQERAPDSLPPGWLCGGKGGGGGGRGGKGGGGGGGGDGCSFEPLLFTSFHTAAGLDDVMAAGGPATVDVTVSHQIGATANPITSFSAQVSYDDGQTWHDVAASDQGNGVYRLQYTQPALSQTNGFAALHIQATDSAGSSIDQTITRAYPLAVTAPATLPGQSGTSNTAVCSAPSAAPYAQCMARVDTAAGISLSQPNGLGPSDIESAYNLSPAAGQGQTVAIVDAYDDPNVEADLAAYRQQYGLPACTSASGCFTKVNQRGQASGYPSPDPGWGVEISLDVDAVSATCPACKILLVEADSSSLNDLLTAVQTAQRLGANVISNSYGSFGEFSGEQTFERTYSELTVPFVVASGDYGYGNGAILIGGVAYPAASQYAIAVGGTSLTRADNARGWTESAWDGATSGCSAYIHKPGWQKDNLCGMRTVADVAAVADPYTGLAVYDTFGYNGWLRVGGTSLAAPIISSVYALAGNGAAQRYASDLYRHAGDLYDVTSGSNGTNCSGTYLCNALPGYDGPTGLGTPDGTGAF